MGPARICPSARPARHAVSVSWTAHAGASRPRPSPGSPGRYMSIDSGPNALSAPRMRTTCARPPRRGAGAVVSGGTMSLRDGSSRCGRRPRDAQLVAAAEALQVASDDVLDALELRGRGGDGLELEDAVRGAQLAAAERERDRAGPLVERDG